MKNFLCMLILSAFFLGALSQSAEAAVAVKTVPAETAVTEAPQPHPMSGKALKGLEKQEKKKAKLEKRLKKWEARLEEKSAAPGVWDDSKFRLGALFLLGAIGFAILEAIGILSGLMGFIAGVLALAGLVLLIWALIEYYG